MGAASSTFEPSTDEEKRIFDDMKARAYLISKVHAREVYDSRGNPTVEGASVCACFLNMFSRHEVHAWLTIHVYLINPTLTVHLKFDSRDHDQRRCFALGHRTQRREHRHLLGLRAQGRRQALHGEGSQYW